jgi:single-stranded-DNA-specific exonuclease
MKGISGREWLLLSEFIKPQKELQERYGYLVAQLLANRNVDDKVFDNKLKNLLPSHLIPNMEQAVERIIRSVKKKERIIIYGDYDVDGITGTVMLYDFLKKADAKVYPVLPTRQTGYGLRKDLVDTFAKYAQLLITVDNGTTAIEELKNSPIETIIIDHHNPHEELPPALIVNPKIDQGAPNELKEISSVALCFYLTARLNRELNVELDVRDYLYLTAIGTLADMMPLNPLNRILVSNGIRMLNYILAGGETTSYGIKMLLEGIGIKGEVTSKDITFSVAPRLNAPGRVSRPKISMNLLLSKDINTARVWFKKVEEANEQRKHISNIAFEKAISEVSSQKERNFLVVRMGEWASGVAGIVAGRLSNLLSKPSAVFSVGKELATASVRGVEGINVYEGLKKLAHMYIKWGGHTSAAGITIRREQVQTFETLVEQVFSQIKKEEPRLYIDMILDPTRVDQEVISALKSLEPYGEGFPPPLFVSPPMRIEKVEIINGRFILRAQHNITFVSYDAILRDKWEELPGSIRKIAYSIDTRKARLFHLVDVEELNGSW